MPFEVASAIWKPPKCPSPADGCTQFTYAEPQAHPRWQAQLAAVAPSHHGLIRPLPPSSSLPTLATSPHLTPRPPSAHCRWATAPSQGSFNSGEPTSWQSGKLPFSPDPPAPLCLPSSRLLLDLALLLCQGPRGRRHLPRAARSWCPAAGEGHGSAPDARQGNASASHGGLERTGRQVLQRI